MADALISVAGLTVAPGVRSNTVRWTVSIGSCLPYLQLSVFELWSAASNDRSLATKVTDESGLSFVHNGLLIGVARYYWARAKDVSGQYSDFFPLSATSGVVGTPTSTGAGSVGSSELQDNSVGGNHIKAAAVTADKASIGYLSALSADLGFITGGVASFGGGRVYIDGWNAQIVISD